MGVFEVDEFSHGTKEITNAIAEMEVYSIVGGGDSVNAINRFSNVDKFNHVSTGGGASLEYLEGKALPGVNIYNQLII
jgi:phosphoglycerate kinase